jgi:hypothetical protein
MRTLVVLVLAGAAVADAQPPVRLEDWARLRTAAAPLLGWKVGIDARNFQQLTLFEAAARVDALGVGHIAGSDAQALSPEIPKKVDYRLARSTSPRAWGWKRSFRLPRPARWRM